jgi:uncharacterized damage-inducible protein DinB
MNSAALLKTQFETIERQFKLVLKDLSLEQLHWQPIPAANSIAFLLWHLLYTWDEYMSLIENREVLYEKEGWPQRFGFETKGLGVAGSGMGTGFTPEDVAIVRPRPEPLLDYLQVLTKEIKSYLKKATDESLSREATVPWWRPKTTTAGRVLAHIIAHSNFHLGETQYVRGLAIGRSEAG